MTSIEPIKNSFHSPINKMSLLSHWMIRQLMMGTQTGAGQRGRLGKGHSTATIKCQCQCHNRSCSTRQERAETFFSFSVVFSSFRLQWTISDNYSISYFSITERYSSTKQIREKNCF
ncbi:hypothetical protein TNCT_247651 [Trichonephila clavata]|uniref:Uncharacterized protein n=1 Tax=Trichonephila clavata TaxID=2740835 RepID=A0A8X6M3W7_TRICU|nr:hypothetical protein TNCT_247651 [Trichonephila clavata]